MLVSDKPVFIDGGCIAALGTFDGVHAGHRAVIASAKQHALPVVIVTSAQNPKQVLGGDGGRIISPSLCDKQFELLGATAVIRLDFNSIRNMTPNEYLDMLTAKINTRGFSLGYNFRFGSHAAGDASTVAEYAKTHLQSCDIREKIDFDGEPLSSTRIRAAVTAGDMESVKMLLGRPYEFNFTVVHGDARGRTIGFPTINQPYPDGYVLPRFGVYSSRIFIEGTEYSGVTNVGVRPTFLAKRALAETAIIGYDGNLYGKSIRVELIRFLRPERRFGSLHELKSQIEADKKAAMND